MAAVLNSLDAQLFELRNFKANEMLYKERFSNKMKPVRGSSPMRLSPKAPVRGTSPMRSGRAPPPMPLSPGRRHVTTADFSKVKVSTPFMAIPEPPLGKPASGSGPSQTNLTPPITVVRETTHSPRPRGTEEMGRALALREPLDGEGETQYDASTPRGNLAPSTPPMTFADGQQGTTEDQDRALAVRVPFGGEEESKEKHESKRNGLNLDEAALKKLAKMVVREMQSAKKKKVPICLDDFTGEKTTYGAEDAIVWLKKLRLAARQNEWDHALALEVASIHLKGLAARWFASIEKHLNEELHLDRDRWDYFETQFEERFADYRSRLLQIEKIKELKLRPGEDIREYAEALMSMNSRLEEPLDDEFLRWVFTKGLPPSDMRDKLYKFQEQHCTMASAVKYARRLQLSQSVFNIKDATPRVSPGSTPGRSFYAMDTTPIVSLVSTTPARYFHAMDSTRVSPGSNTLGRSYHVMDSTFTLSPGFTPRRSPIPRSN